MKKRVLVLYIGVAVISFLLGFEYHIVCEKQKTISKEVVRKMFQGALKTEFDFLLTHKKTDVLIKDGSYVFEVWFPGNKIEENIVELKCGVSGRLLGAPHVNRNSLSCTQEGNIITWMFCDAEEGPEYNYIGIIEESEMWGRVYKMPGTDWRPSPPAIGFWRVYPESSINISTNNNVIPEKH